MVLPFLGLYIDYALAMQMAEGHSTKEEAGVGQDPSSTGMRDFRVLDVSEIWEAEKLRPALGQLHVHFT